MTALCVMSVLSSSGRGGPPRRASFTLVELMVVIAIISLVASAVLFAMYGVMEDAKAARTQSQITRINELLMTKWESYRTRPVPIVIPPGTPPRTAAFIRLNAIRELMRMELPDRRLDVEDGAVSGITAPTLWGAYNRRVALIHGSNWKASQTTWTRTHQGAECLYMILAETRDGGSNGLEFFAETEIGDVDGDQMPEILDGWGRPIEFLRWAPGFSVHFGPDGAWGFAGVDDDSDGITDNSTEALAPGSDDLRGYSDIQDRNPIRSPDPFDVLRIDANDPGPDGVWGTANGGPNNDGNDDGDANTNEFDERGWPGSDDRTNNFALFPLIFSAGPDGIYDIHIDAPTSPIRYAIAPPVAAPSGFPPNLQNSPYLWFEKECPPGSGTVVPWQLGMFVNVDSNCNPTGEYRDNIHNHMLNQR